MPKYPHGELDRVAAVLLAAHPEYDIDEITTVLDCSEGSLRNRKKYPRFADAWESFKGGCFTGVRLANRRRNGRRTSGKRSDED